MIRVSHRSTAMTVAERAPPLRTAISPRISPGPRTARTRTLPSRDVRNAFTRPAASASTCVAGSPSRSSTAPGRYVRGPPAARMRAHASAENLTLHVSHKPASSRAAIEMSPRRPHSFVMGEIIQNAANVAAAAQWPDTVSRYGMRGLFHALSDPDSTDPGPVLDHAVTRPWMAEAARRLSTLAVLDRTRPAQPGDRELTDTLYLLHAASRVRDILLLAHQPPPLDPAGLTSLDEALGRTPPSFGPVPVSRIAAFFARLGCRPVTEPSFDPVLHEIIAW